ncbi:MAG: LysM peptidoglycan-binding domain-containing protein [Blastochloris sp.]|nr:LysM peptidoglycan-binding domain-containing protein [Blastochloris sp.]
MLVLALVSPLTAQYADPAAREDEAIERQKILRAADQLELLVQQNQKLQEDMGKLQLQIQALQEDKAALHKRLDDMEKTAAKDKQALLKEVAGLVASSKGSAAVSPRPEAPPKTEGAKQEGYEYEVKTGDSLWAISKAYQDAGVKVSVDDIRQANNMDRSQNLRAGQKLFIPKK